MAAITAPGGPGRASVRVTLEDGRSVIATRRENPERSSSEAALLTLLAKDGAPTPKVIGYRDGLLIQSDAGRERLSWRMAQAVPAERLALARAAIRALEACRTAIAQHSDVLADMTGLGTRPDWSDAFVARPVFLSGDLRIGAPRIDTDALAQSLTHGPDRFTRWDARLGNAAVQPDGSIVWFDWETFGRRAGVEDISWMLADPGWTLGLDQTAKALGDINDIDTERGLLLRRMAVMIAANRLGPAHRALRSSGWPTDGAEALRLDRIVTTREALSDHCERMALMAAEDPMVRGFTPWFREAAEAFVVLKAAA